MVANSDAFWLLESYPCKGALLQHSVLMTAKIIAPTTMMQAIAIPTIAPVESDTTELKS